MADLRVSHLSVGQADIQTRGAQLRVRTGGPEPVEGRRACLAHRIVGLLGTATPAVQNDEHYGLFCHVSSHVWCLTPACALMWGIARGPSTQGARCSRAAPRSTARVRCG